MRSAAVVIGATFLLSSSIASAAITIDCPPGSYEKTEEGFSWCQPSVCRNDGDCDHGYICKPVALCTQVGQLAEAGATVDGGARLVVTQICGEDKTCPQLQTCLAASRCVSPQQADKMDAPTNAPAPAPKKSSCSCDAVGTEVGHPGYGAVAAFAFSAWLVRARKRAARPSRR